MTKKIQLFGDRGRPRGAVSGLKISLVALFCKMWGDGSITTLMMSLKEEEGCYGILWQKGTRPSAQGGGG